MRFLLDENTSPLLAQRLNEAGHDAWHVRDRRLAGTADHIIWRRAIEEGRILVTIDARDFLRLAAREELHGGLIAIPYGLDPDAQWNALRRILTWALDQGSGDLMNRVVRIEASGRFTVFDFPAGLR